MAALFLCGAAMPFSFCMRAVKEDIMSTEGLTEQHPGIEGRFAGA